LIPVRRACQTGLVTCAVHAVYGRMITQGGFARICTLHPSLPSHQTLVCSPDMTSSFPPVTTHSLTTTPLDAETLSDGELSPDSLFDELLLPPGTRTVIEVSPENVDLTCTGGAIARRSAPPIPGLFFDPSLLLPADLADSVLRSCMRSFFADHGGAGAGGADVNQVMLFGRAGHDSGSSSAFPPFLNELLVATSELLGQHPTLPRETHAMLFPSAPHVPRARQAIINLYRPGEGIAPHVDLLRRFGDGIVGVSLGGGGVAMRFARAETRETSTGGDGGGDGGEYEVWLPSRSVLVLAGEARYEWTHGITPCLRDKVEVIAGAGEGDASGWQWLERGIRVSVTFRWLLPGADVVGGDSISDDEENHETGTRADVGRWDGGDA
jgi:2-oxoglutarate-Fe(II)-dependent oxygenase superfamily protein